MQRLSLIVIGVVVVAIGILWTLQGLDVVGSGGMSGHGVWAVVGIVLIVVGLGVLGFVARLSRSGGSASR
jgi:uncharacterized membrane protein